MASDLAGITLLDVTPEKNASNQEAVAKWVKDLRMPADKGRRVIRCEGTAFDFRTIDKDHKICRLERELSYSLTDVTITICNPTVTMRSSLVIKDGKKEILHGTYSAEGVFENPNAYMIYRVERPSTGEPWRGVSKVRIVPAYDIVGLWMAEGHFEQGKTCLGTFRLRRLDE